MAAKEPSPPPSAMVEYKSLSSISDKLISMIACDPLPLANVLFARGLISKAKLSSASQGKYEQATEIVHQVLNVVQHIPQKFEVFLSAVRELPWMQALAESIEETFKKLKEEAEEVSKFQTPICAYHPDYVEGPFVDGCLKLTAFLVVSFPNLTALLIINSAHEGCD